MKAEEYIEDIMTVHCEPFDPTVTVEEALEAIRIAKEEERKELLEELIKEIEDIENHTKSNYLDDSMYFKGLINGIIRVKNSVKSKLNKE